MSYWFWAASGVGWADRRSKLEARGPGGQRRRARDAAGTGILGLAAGIGVGLAAAAFGQTTLNVTSFGAVGDAVRTWASTSSNSPVVWSTNLTTSSDIGKVIELFGVGPYTSLTNNQDLVATITNVSNGTNWLITPPPSASSNNVQCTYGSQNAPAFQNCLNACTGTNTVVQVPAGTYLLVPPSVLNAGYKTTVGYSVAYALTNYGGGITLAGQSPSNTILLGSGAWTLEGPYGQRGTILCVAGPVTNNYPLLVQNLTFDGGVLNGFQTNGIQPNTASPANPIDGSGWDISHCALVDLGPGTLLSNRQFLNCRFIHWRGEMLKSVTSFDRGLTTLTNCWLVDGNADGFNLNCEPHIISGCLFSNLLQGVEFYCGTMNARSFFVNNTVTSMEKQGCAILGALTTCPSPGYTIQSNTFSAVPHFCILLGPACNVQIAGNRFIGSSYGVGTDGYAFQGTDYNHDITVASNAFIGIGCVINIGGDGQDRLVNMTVNGNVATNCGAYGGGYAWCSNVVFLANLATGTNIYAQLSSGRLEGQYFLDDLSNTFPFQQSYDPVGQTNIITYATGIRQQISTANTNSVYLLDDHSPLQIPPTARLVITNLANLPVSLYSSSTSPLGPPVQLSNGDGVEFDWLNGRWVKVPKPPSDLRLSR